MARPYAILPWALLLCVPGHCADVSERLGPYMVTSFLDFGVDKNPKYTEWKKQYQALSQEEKVHYCIEQLANERYDECGFSARPSDRYTADPEGASSHELIRLGKAAMPDLIAALDRKEKTQILPSRHSTSPWLIQDAAVSAIQQIACCEFTDAIRRSGGEKSYLAALSADQLLEIKQRIGAWWAEHQQTDEAAWAEAVLMKDDGPYRAWAASTLYRRLGADSYPILLRAYRSLPAGGDRFNDFDAVTHLKLTILYCIEREATKRERECLMHVLGDGPFPVRLQVARCLWKLGDDEGLKRIPAETEKMLPSLGGELPWTHAANLIGFLRLCRTPEAKAMIIKCLGAHNPDLRNSALGAVPELKMKETAQEVAKLLDDPYVLNGSYQSTQGDFTITVPPRQICDEAAETLNKLVPDSPRFEGATDGEQQQSVRRIAAWWREHANALVWHPEEGVFRAKP